MCIEQALQVTDGVPMRQLSFLVLKVSTFGRSLHEELQTIYLTSMLYLCNKWCTHYPLYVHCGQLDWIHV